MRLDELFVNNLTEETAVAKDQVIATATIVPAHIYDMKGIPFPTNSEGKVDPSLFVPQKVRVGHEEGMVTPEQVSELNNWYDNGSVPGGLGEDYNSQWFITDAAYDFLGGLDDYIRASLKGQAIQVDGALKREVSLNMGLKSIGLKSFDDASKYTTIDVVNSIYDARDSVFKFFGAEKGFPKFSDWADKHYKDQKDITAGAVQNWGDLTNLAGGGSKWADVRWQGVAGMLASEAPSDLINWAATTFVGTAAGTATANPAIGVAAGFAVNSHLSTIEAMGFAAEELDAQVQKLYDEGVLQKTDQWKNALEITGGDEANAVRYMQKSTYAATVIRSLGGIDGLDLTTMQAVGVTAGTLDAIVDKLVFGSKIPLPGLRNWVGRAVVAAGTEGADESLQQLFKNRGLIDAAGAPITETEGMINAGWNGAILGGSRSAASDTIRAAGYVGRVTKDVLGAFGSSAKDIAAGRARIRDFLYGKQNHDGDPEAFGEIIKVIANSPEVARMSDLITNEDGELDLEKFVDQDMPAFEDLTRAQQRGKGTIDLGNGNVVSAIVGVRAVRANDYAKQYFPILQNSVYNKSTNEYQSSFKNEQEALRAAQLLGFKKGMQGTDDGFDAVENVDEVIEYLEGVVGYDVRVSGRTEFESPNFNTMTAQQRSDFYQLGKVKAGRFTFSREDIVKQSVSDNVGVPSNVLDFVRENPQPVESRPTMETIAIGKVNTDIINSAEADAYQEMTEDQEAWDEEFSATHNPDGSPKNPNAEGIAGRQLTDDDTREGLGGRRPAKGVDIYDEIAKNKLLTNSQYVNAIKRKAEVEEDLAVAQKKWDLENSDTHHHSGNVKIKGAMLDHVYAKYDDKILRDQRVKDKKEAAEKIVNDALEEKNNDIVQSPRGTDLARASIVYNQTLKVADGTMSKEALQATLDKLEQSYPGISEQIMGDMSMDDYDQFSQALQSKSPEKPQIQIIQPQEERTIGDETFVWKGYQWASVKTGRMATKEQQKKLFTPQEAEKVPYVDTGTYKPQVQDSSPSSLTAPGEEIMDADLPGADKSITVPKEPAKLPDAQGPDDAANVDTTTTQPKDSPRDGGNPGGTTLATPTVDKDDADNIELDTTAPEQPASDATAGDSGVTTTPNKDKPVTTTVPDFVKSTDRTDSDPEIKTKQIDRPNVQTTAPEQPGADDGDDELNISTSDITEPNVNKSTPKLGTPSDADKNAELAKIAQDKLDKIKADAEKEAKKAKDAADAKVKADADAFADLEAQADKATKDAEAERDAERELTPDLNPAGPNFDKKLPGQTTDDGPVRFIPTKTLTKQQKDALAGRGEFATPEPKVKDTGTPDAGKDVKDKDPNKAGIQTQTDIDNMVQPSDDADNIDIDTTPKSDPEVKTNRPDALDLPAVTPLVKPNIQIDKDPNTKTKTNKDSKGKKKFTPGILLNPFGDSDKDKDDILKRMRFGRGNYADPLKLGKLKGAMARSQGLKAKGSQ